MEKIKQLTEICYPYIEVEKLDKNEVKRLIRKLVRQKDMILQSVHILFEFSCPLFVFNDLQLQMGNMKFTNFNLNLDDICFETPSGFSDKHKGEMVCLFKKVKSVLKLVKSDDISEEELLYLLPLSTIVTFNAYVDFLEIYDMVTCIQSTKVHPKTKELSIEIFELVCGEFPLFFTKQNLEIFLANKEK